MFSRALEDSLVTYCVLRVPPRSTWKVSKRRKARRFSKQSCASGVRAVSRLGSRRYSPDRSGRYDEELRRRVCMERDVHIERGRLGTPGRGGCFCRKGVLSEERVSDSFHCFRYLKRKRGLSAILAEELGRAIRLRARLRRTGVAKGAKDEMAMGTELTIRRLEFPNAEKFDDLIGNSELVLEIGDEGVAKGWMGYLPILEGKKIFLCCGDFPISVSRDGCEEGEGRRWDEAPRTEDPRSKRVRFGMEDLTRLRGGTLLRLVLKGGTQPRLYLGFAVERGHFPGDARGQRTG